MKASYLFTNFTGSVVLYMYTVVVFVLCYIDIVCYIMYNVK